MILVKLDELDPEQRTAIDQALTIVRDKQVPVANLDKYIATEVAREVSKRLGHPFTVTEHTACWKHYGVRPPAGGKDKPEATDAKYCVWDRIAERHVYTRAWVNKLAADLSDRATFTTVGGHEPRPTPTAENADRDT